jgi:protein-S-isoprenylcysteine O-methyltransferase Ste14
LLGLMHRPWFPKPYAEQAAKLRVPSGFLVLGVFVLLSRPDYQSAAVGLPLSLAGLLLRGWAAGHLAKNIRLATGGPYAWVRNPLYLGTLLAAGGFAIASRSPLLAVVFATVFLLIYLPVIEQEEEHLRALFAEYAAYAERVPWLWPRRPREAGGERFRWDLYLRNQEYQALAAFAAGCAFLLWRI